MNAEEKLARVLLGSTIHTDAKEKTVGKSYGGLFGSTNHYDTKGHKVGRTDPGLFGTQNHRDERGRQIGESTPGLWGTTDTEIKSGIGIFRLTFLQVRFIIKRYSFLLELQAVWSGGLLNDIA